MQGICVGPEAVQVKGIVSDTRLGRQDIYQEIGLVHLWEEY